MARRKSLNIHNTDRMFNLNLTTKQDEANFVKVTSLNYAEVEKNMDELAQKSRRFKVRDDKRYLLFKQKYSNDTLHSKILSHGGFITYYTSNRVPMPIINQLAQVPHSEVMYLCKKNYDLEDVKNIQLASMATKVVIDVPIVLPDINIYDYLFCLYPLRYHVDSVKISFPALKESEIQERHKHYYTFYNGAWHLKSKFKYQCFQYLQEPLSTWKMNIWIVCDSQRDLRNLERRVKRDNKRFKVEEPLDEGGVANG